MLQYFPSLTPAIFYTYSPLPECRPRMPGRRAYPCGGNGPMAESKELRRLATWYREFAERAGNPWIWEARLATADKLEKEADHLEKNTAQIGRVENIVSSD
jgi:hypothetical protein